MIRPIDSKLKLEKKNFFLQYMKNKNMSIFEIIFIFLILYSILIKYKSLQNKIKNFIDLLHFKKAPG